MKKRMQGLNLSSPDYESVFYGCGAESSAMCKNLNSFIDTIRSINTNMAVADGMRKFKRAANDNYRSATEYIAALFKNKSRLLIVRIDLGYKKFTGDSFNRNAWHGNDEISVEEFLLHRENLIKNFRRHFVFEDLSGYLIKAEHSKEKGFHLHCLFSRP
ncbi:inovirus-type Gp2 protein [Ferrovum myxofaciens]|uniref:Inovirus Gp2 family protein n=1 Tax=Ferrovum myxofaciens TaxID=416213 RepID=A0A9E6MXH8_9PROT|nr:inovirus-type Gp2 protein [Ferrovum myxofaciens]QKE37699.1 MAG: hypothetical protein HO273_02235 [Ferrovum myxofaciens]QWY75360.1 MAG: hypothetical protein JVY19_02670 [Ferrovum myxofaciens]QWY78100.1 MAG: hypothetical protein JZL65_03190 [Ferrovum myxofaciens]